MIGTCAMGSDTILRWLAGIFDKLRKSSRCGGLQYVLIPRPKESLLDGSRRSSTLMVLYAPKFIGVAIPCFLLVILASLPCRYVLGQLLLRVPGKICLKGISESYGKSVAVR